MLSHESMTCRFASETFGACFTPRQNLCSATQRKDGCLFKREHFLFSSLKKVTRNSYQICRSPWSAGYAIVTCHDVQVAPLSLSAHGWHFLSTWHAVFAYTRFSHDAMGSLYEKNKERYISGVCRQWCDSWIIILCTWNKKEQWNDIMSHIHIVSALCAHKERVNMQCGLVMGALNYSVIYCERWAFFVENNQAKLLLYNYWVVNPLLYLANDPG